MKKKFNWKKTILSLHNSIADAIVCLNKTSARIVIVTQKKKFYGIINDGDIRRGFLRGLKITDSLSKIVQKKPIVCKPDDPIQKIKNIMVKNQIYQIPIIDNKKNILGINTIENIENRNLKDTIFVIVAGGFGKRLLPLTSKTPKPMLKIDGVPMIEKIILKASSEGFLNFIISVHYKKNVIKKYLGNGKKYGINIKYLEEKKPLGTAGFLSILKHKKNTNLVVTNADVYSQLKYENLLNFHISQNSKITTTVKIHQYINPYGVVRTNGNNILEIVEKPSTQTFVNVGVYVINTNIIKYLKTNTKIDMTDFINLIINKKISCIAFPLHERWEDFSEKYLNKK